MALSDVEEVRAAPCPSKPAGGTPACAARGTPVRSRHTAGIRRRPRDPAGQVTPGSGRASCDPQDNLLPRRGSARARPVPVAGKRKCWGHPPMVTFAGRGTYWCCREAARQGALEFSEADSLLPHQQGGIHSPLPPSSLPSPMSLNPPLPSLPPHPTHLHPSPYFPRPPPHRGGWAMLAKPAGARERPHSGPASFTLSRKLPGA